MTVDIWVTNAFVGGSWKLCQISKVISNGIRLTWVIKDLSPDSLS